ncbi:ATP-binding protein [Streptococcus sp. DD04]|uniref:ATP-binding protein n=1 Tax=Streptococcus sp. DD04 TaxID=1776578 RepID=UPI00078320E3|nr:ATP-binding protein [Streptococcus sp. DD04]KXT63029.1 DNA mismatch repair enzyme (putative ATPase) [Streptococcus sp. DD04]
MPNKVEQVPITVAGNILSELSEKIPNNIIALNELIKNAYDACSPSVDITLDSESRLLTIRDYGIGMDTEGIKKLFHISSSDKHYGEIISYKDTKRLTQGSKGLGFLSVFRFGKKVYWKTAQNTQISEFTVDFDSLVTEYNITDKRLDVTLSSSGDFIGTLIQIEINDYNVNTLKRYLSEEVNRNKILNSFIDDKISDGKISADKNFIIKLNIDGEINSTDYEIQLQTQNKPQQLFEINYSSSDQNLVFRKDGKDIFSEEFSFNSDRYSLDISLAAYYLVSKGKSKINSLFYNPTNNNLTPLIYINNNLFNNYMLFDTELMGTKKYSEVLKQLIGYISIKSSDSSIQFNSDRTQFSQSELTDEIAHFIEKLNEEIQRIGASLKNELRDFSSKTFIQNRIPEEETSNPDNLKKYIKPNFKLKDSIIFKKQGNKLKCTLFDEETLLDIIPKAKKTIDLGTVESWIDIDDLNKKITNLNELIQVATDIYFNEEKVSEFNKLQEGEWLISQETDTTVSSLKIILRKPAQPKISQRENILKKGIDYKVDDLFTFTNSFGEEDKGLQFEIDTKNNPTINFNKGIISFGRLNENTISIKITDKKTGLIHEADFTFRVVEDNFDISQLESSNRNLVSMPINKEVNFRPDVVSFIGEINRIFNTDDYSFVAVAAYRTLIEIVVNDILDNSDRRKTESLLQNYRQVIEEGENSIDKSELDAKDKQTLKSLLKSIGSRDESESFLAFLNLSTHGGTRIITKVDVMKKTQEIKLLLGLLYISEVDKNK